MTNEQQRIKDTLDLASIPGITILDIRRFLATGRLPSEEDISLGDPVEAVVLNLPWSAGDQTAP